MKSVCPGNGTKLGKHIPILDDIRCYMLWMGFLVLAFFRFRLSMKNTSGIFPTDGFLLGEGQVVACFFF